MSDTIPLEFQRTLSRIINEKVYLIERDAIFYSGAAINYSTPAVLLVTNKRIICFLKKYEGIITQNFIGYEKSPYEVPLNEIIDIEKSKFEKNALKIRSKQKYIISNDNLNGIGLDKNINMLYDLINKLKNEFEKNLQAQPLKELYNEMNNNKIEEKNLTLIHKSILIYILQGLSNASELAQTMNIPLKEIIPSLFDLMNIGFINIDSPQNTTSTIKMTKQGYEYTINIDETTSNKIINLSKAKIDSIKYNETSANENYAQEVTNEKSQNKDNGKILAILSLLIMMGGFALPWITGQISALVLNIRANVYVWGIDAQSSGLWSTNRQITMTWFQLSQLDGTQAFLSYGGNNMIFSLIIYAGAFVSLIIGISSQARILRLICGLGIFTSLFLFYSVISQGGTGILGVSWGLGILCAGIAAILSSIAGLLPTTSMVN